MKKIYDSVHGFIKCSALERELIDSLPFQRMRHIRQLGIAYMVYPGATHSRLEHSLGVMELASRIFDQIIPHSTFTIDVEYWRQIVRLAALSHDLGHLPFSHVAEKALLNPRGHEYWTLKILEGAAMQPIWDHLHEKHKKHNVVDDVIKMSLGEKQLGVLFPDRPIEFTPFERVLSQIVSGDFFGADRIDYLLRDARGTGVSYGLFDYQQLIESLRILPSVHQSDQLELGIEENGIESCEALLLGRHFMYKRVYQVSSVKAYSFHMSRFLATYLPTKVDLDDIPSYVTQTDNEILTALQEISRDSSHSAHLDAVCFFDRYKRFKAVEIARDVTEEELLSVQENLQIPDQMISWSFSKETKEPPHFSFPVLTRNQDILEASHFSNISITSKRNHWVFIAPEYEKRLTQALAQTRQVEDIL